MTKETKALRLALEALDWNMVYLPSQGYGTTMARNAITAANKALARPEQEPVTDEENGAQPALDMQRHNDYMAGFDEGYSRAEKNAALQPAQPDQKQTGIREIRATETVKQEQEPVGFVRNDDGEAYWIHDSPPPNTDLYTTPPSREWVDLTEQEALDCFSPNPVTHRKNIAAKLKKKNT